MKTKKLTTKERIDRCFIENFRIKTFEQLLDSVEQKRSVVFKRRYPGQRPMPAVVLLNMSGSVIARRLEHGTYIYRKDIK